MTVFLRTLFNGWLGGLCLAVLSGCSGQLDSMLDDYLPDKEPEYKSSKRLPPLEVPPDLGQSSISQSLRVPSNGSGTTYSQYASQGQESASGAGSAVLPESTSMRVERDGDERWLVLDVAPAQVWPQLRDFWLEQGFIIEVDDPSIGIMETDWAEHRSNFGSGLFGTLFSNVSSSLYGASTRDKFRPRLEKGAKLDSTEVYISHRGAEEVSRTVDAFSTAERYDEKYWQPRPSDPELEAEMLSRLMVHLGVAKKQAADMVSQGQTQPDRARMLRDASGASVLAVDEDFSRAWRRTGLALDRVGFTVEDRDRSRGLYFVRYIDPQTDVSGEKSSGILSALKFWESDEPPEPTEYLISLVGNEANTQVVVLNKEGNRDTSPTADRILALLYDQLR